MIHQLVNHSTNDLEVNDAVKVSKFYYYNQVYTWYRWKQEIMSEFSEEAFKQLQLDYNFVLSSLKDEQKKSESLEEECDMLAVHNCRLEAEIAELKKLKETRNITVDSNKSVTAAVEKLSLDNRGSSSVSAGPFVQESAMVIANAAGASNVLSVGLIPSHNITLCGGVDKTLRMYDLASGEARSYYQFAAPVLAIDVFTPVGLAAANAVALVGCSMMDGSHAVVTVTPSSVSSGADGDASDGSIQMFHDHSKYVVCLRFSPDGRHFATCSYDKSVNVYGYGQVGDEHDYVKLCSYRFQTTPESLVFINMSATEGETAYTATELVVALRDVSYLVYITDLPSPPSYTDTVSPDVIAVSGDVSVETDGHHRKVSLNENEWDTHVSFTPLFLSASPSGEFLLVSTSHSMHYCYRTGTNARVQTLTGHTSNEYSKPRTCWGSESVIYSNTEACGDIFVFFLHSARILHVIGGSDGHRGIVKDLVTHPSLPNTLVSGSFDKTVRVWKPI